MSHRGRCKHFHPQLENTSCRQFVSLIYSMRYGTHRLARRLPLLTGMDGTKTIWRTLIWLTMLSTCASASTLPVEAHRFRQTEAPVATLHHSEFDRATQKCELVQAPEALATPDPLLNSVDPDSKVAVSFVIGIDGRVHSPVILESAGHSRRRPRAAGAAPLALSSRDLQRRSHRNGK